MRSALGSAVTMGLMIVVAGGCRSESGRNVGQGGAEPIASSPTFPAVPGAEDQPSEPPAIGGGPAEPDHKTTPAEAAASFASARCQHYARCDNVGPNKKYKSQGECLSKVQTDQSKKFNDKACPGGINESNFKGCLRVLRDEKCGSPIGALEHADSCKTDVICVK